MIVLDLEWNRSYDRTPLSEILQIGAVRVERLGGRVLDTFNVYIRPTVHRRFDPGAKALPELAASRSSGLRFPDAFRLFDHWCGADRVFALWGGGDFEVLAENCRYWRLPALKPERVYDLQTAFSWLAGTTQQVALWRAVDYCRVPDTFTFHNALNDAMYTAVLAAWITPEALAYRKPPRAERRAAARLPLRSFPEQPGQKVGPFPTVEEVLNARHSRSPLCPLCGGRGCVAQWNALPPGEDPAGPRQYFAVFSCPAHGRFLCRLTLGRENGAWVGRRTVPSVTPEVLREYAGSLRGKVHICKSRRPRRRRRRRGKNRAESGQSEQKISPA